MIPDNVEKIIMTKEDYDRNVEQLLVEKLKLEQLREDVKNHIKIASEYKEQMIIKDNNWNELKKFIENELNNNVDKEKSFGGYQCKIILDKIEELEGKK